LTDDDDGPDDAIGIFHVQDASGTLKIHYLSSEKTLSCTKPSANGIQAGMKIQELTKMFHSLSPKAAFEQLANDSIYGYIAKETVRYAVNVKNEEDLILTADEAMLFVGFCLLAAYHKLPSE
jgi:hypothetical protein